MDNIPSGKSFMSYHIYDGMPVHTNSFSKSTFDMCALFLSAQIGFSWPEQCFIYSYFQAELFHSDLCFKHAEEF